MRRTVQRLPGWDRPVWRISYIVVFLLWLLSLGSKASALAAVFFFAFIAVGCVAWADSKGYAIPLPGLGQRLVTSGLRLHGGALFPGGRVELVEDQLSPPWPDELKRAARRRSPILVIPQEGAFISQYGAEASVALEHGVFALTGERRVRVLKTTFPKPDFPRCNYAVLSDEPVGEAESRGLVASIKRDFLRWAELRPDGRVLTAALEREQDPGRVTDLVAQAMVGAFPQFAANYLGATDVGWRLRSCASALSPPDIPNAKSADAVAVREPEELERLDAIGGMEDLKRQIRETIGFLLEHQDIASHMRVEMNGILLYGPPGTGKTMIARATAGEYDLRFLSVSGGDISADGLMGVAEQKIRSVFRAARDHAPCLLFFDEFDSMAGRRGAGGGNEQHVKQVVGTLLREIEEVRKTPGVIVMAATNEIDSLDPALIRSGRFDARIRVDNPDAEARRSIFQARLRDVPHDASLDLDRLVRETEGRSGADITALVESAKLAAVRRGTGAGRPAVSTVDLEQALRSGRGREAPTLPAVSWEEVILPEETKAELRQLTRILTDPGRDEFRGLKRPSGALLYGPPGTGKTTIARAIASEIRGGVSFIAVKGSDLVSKWVGDSEKHVRDVFARARANAPCVIFIDELETILPKRGEGADSSAAHREGLLTEFLQQLDGLDSVPGIFVLAATNHPDRIDPAVLRGGRIGRRIEIPLPGLTEREALLRLHTREFDLAGDVDLAALARMTERASGADLEALCQAAGETAYARGEGPRAVTNDDFLTVLRRRRTEARLPERGWDELILPAETVSQLKSLARLIADPEAGREFGVRPPSGALLAGPPGTGKTTIAQVLASQLRGEVTFLSAKGSDLVSKYVGESAGRVRDLFDRARAQPPAIIFIDEIDALLPARREGADAEREGILTEFLQQLDGLDSTPGVFVLGATNLPERIDPAVTRSGRLGRRIDIPLPDLAGRRALFDLHSARLQLDPAVDLGELAAATEGASGAAIEGICDDAAEHGFSREVGPRLVTSDDFAVALRRWRAATESPASLATW